MTNHTQDAAQVAAQHQPLIRALRAYLARTGYSPQVIDPAIAEAIANLVNRPDITRPMAFCTTIARGEAERLTAEAEAAGDTALSAPDLLKALSGPAPRRRRAPARRTAPKPATQPTEPQGRLV